MVLARLARPSKAPVTADATPERWLGGPVIACLVIATPEEDFAAAAFIVDEPRVAVQTESGEAVRGELTGLE